MNEQTKSRRVRWVSLVGGLAILIFVMSCNAQTPVDTGGNSASEDVTPFPTSAALAKPTYKVERGDVVGLSHFSGQIKPVVERKLYFHINGHARNTYVKEGDTVHAGQVLADLEGVDDLQRKETADKINIQRSQIFVEIAQLNLDYFLKTASPSAPGYDDQLALQKHQVEITQLDVTEASLGLTETQDSISNSSLTAPMDGLVTAIDLEEGSEVNAFTTVATVADLNELEVSSSLTSSKWDNLIVGMPAIIKANGGHGQDTTGVVRSLPSDVTGGTDPKNEPTLRIKMDKSPTELGYKLGDLVKVDIIVEQSLNTLWVPPQVIRTFDNRNFVVVQDGNIQRRVDVKLGVVGDVRVEILEGLAEGQIVVSP
jgi:membrane fusion protein, macrolide-specific efflux system